MRPDPRRSPALQVTTDEGLPADNASSSPERVVFALGRRDFCRIALGCAAALAVGCVSGEPALGTGPIPEGSGDEPDAAEDPTPDARPGTPDARPGTPDARPTPDATVAQAADAGAPTCTTGYQSVGSPTTFTTGTAVYFSSFKLFVVRDSGGLYAVSSVCTHQGATIQQKGSEFYCPRHGATFSLNGTVTGGPASRALAHYAMCMMAGDVVGVNPSATTSASTRLDV